MQCPCCDQWSKTYKRKLNSAMAFALIQIVKEWWRTKDWVHVPQLFRTLPITKGLDAALRGGDYAKLELWQLIFPKADKDDPMKRTSGLWRPTDWGINFVCGKVGVPSHVFVYNGRRVGHADARVHIAGALGQRFDWRDVLGQVPVGPGDQSSLPGVC